MERTLLETVGGRGPCAAREGEAGGGSPEDRAWELCPGLCGDSRHVAPSSLCSTSNDETLPPSCRGQEAQREGAPEGGAPEVLGSLCLGDCEGGGGEVRRPDRAGG